MLIPRIARTLRPFILAFERLAPLGDLLARLWVAMIFFKSGLVKVESWHGTVMLFQYEYHVPLLNPHIAAVLGTGAELILPIMLVIGLGGRFMLLSFFLYNAIAMVSYPFLWTPEGETGLAQHINWALLLMLLMFHGAGKLSLDHWLRLRHGHHADPVGHAGHAGKAEPQPNSIHDKNS